MADTLEREIRDLRARFWSERDPEGRVFAPLADACRRAGDLAEATRLVADGRERLPMFAPGHLVAARVARDRGEVEEAEAAYRKVLELDPENVQALEELADLAEGEGWDAEAADLLHRLSALEPDDGSLRERLRDAKRRHLADELGEPTPPPGGTTGVEDQERPVPGAESPSEEAGRRSAGPEVDAPVEPEVLTRTMGELYARQGHYRRAVRVFERLVERSPDDRSLRERLEELRSRSEDATPPAADPVQGTPPPAGIGAVGSPEGAGDSDETETLAREWAEGPDRTGELSTPFAWGEEGEEGSEAPGGPSAGDRFRQVLEWEARAAEPAGAEGEESAHVEDVPTAKSEGPVPADEGAAGEGAGEDAEGSGGSDDDFQRWLEDLEG